MYYINSPFSTAQAGISDVGNSLPWSATYIPLNYMLFLFYNVRNFSVAIETDTVGTIGVSTRQMQSPPNILNQIAAARKNNSSNLATLLQQAESKAAPGETLGFLSSFDVNTKCQYPIHKYSGDQIQFILDMGSVKRIGSLYCPAVWVTTGTIGSIEGANLIGSITLQINKTGGYQVGVYGNGGDGAFAYGTVIPNELYSDLAIQPTNGPTGTIVTIGTIQNSSISDPSNQRIFTGFHNVKRISYDGFDIPFSVNSTTIGTNSKTNKPIINETCSVQIPDGANSSHFSFYSEGSDSNGPTVCDQFSTSSKFIVI